MGILSRPRFLPQQRLDLEDVNAQLSALRTDSKLYTKQFLSQSNLIYKGFTVSGIGLKSATVNMADATLIFPQNSFDFSWFTSAPSEPNVVIPDADLTDGVRNYVEIELVTENNTPLTKAFWDSEANSGLGSEFNQIVDTITDLKVNFVVSTGGFSASPDRIPLCIIDTDGSGTIKTIFDRRNLFGRLAKPTDVDNSFAWGTKVEPVYSMSLTGVSGVFVDGEEITIGTETATVVTGGTSAITFNVPSGINFSNGDSVTGTTSGATGTVNTIAESFTGVDKNLKTQKDINDAMQTEIKNLKGVRFWWQDAGTSVIGVGGFLNAILVQSTTATRFKWDGSNFFITDSAVTPASSDVMAYIRQLGKGTDVALARQDDGKEIQKLAFSIVPSSGTYTLEQDGDISDPINWNDNAAAVEAACNAQFTNQVSVSGNTTDGFLFTFDTAGPQVALTEDSNTLVNGATPVTLTVTTVKNGLAGISAIPIADGEVLFVKLPLAGNRTFSGIGSGDTNYQVVDAADFVANDENYWIAYCEDGLLYVRNLGELEIGEETPISDPDKETILSLLAAETLRSSQDRNAKLVEGGTWAYSLSGNNLTLSANAFIQIPGLNNNRNTIPTQTINLPNATSVAYVKLERSAGGSNNLTVMVNDQASVLMDSDTFVIARRVTDGVLVGTHSFLLQPGEYLTLDGALAELNKYFGQLKLRRHESAANKARINASDVNLLDGEVLTKLIGPFLLDFTGAVINFTTGVINKEDDSTALGVNFTPFSVPVGQYFWYGISITPSAVEADNRQSGQIQVEPANNGSATQNLAPKPTVSGDIPLGAVQVFNNAGTIEIVKVNRLGVGSGSGGSGRAIKANYLDPMSTSLPTGTSVTIDGQSGVNGDLVLFTNLITDNNRIYELSGVGVSLVWTPKRSFSSQFDPLDGDSVRILEGDSFGDQLATFNGTDFLVNDVVRFFDGVSGDFWELGSIKTADIADNTTDNVFSINVVGSENIIVNYSIIRGSAKETGQLFITSDGTNAVVTKTNAYLLSAGVEFTASVSVGVLQLDYTSDNTGTGVMKFFLQRWSDSAGGPTGVPSYSGSSGGGQAGGANTEVQFNNAGVLTGDSRFKFDASLGAVDLNGLKVGALSSGVTLNDNEAAPVLAVQFPNSFRFVIVEYSIQRDTDHRVGRLLIANNGSTISLSDDFVETGSTGITFSAAISGANANINYVSTNTGQTGTLKYSIRRWS